MPAEKALPLDGIPEAPHPTESLTAVRADVQTQLSSPKDISAASNFFKPQGAESFLPSMPTPSGMEAAALTPAGMPMPGAEQMSPLINMIMKMPGHLSLASSFFEFLGSFFGGGDMLSMLDPITGQIMDGLNGLGEHLGIDLSLLPDDAPGLTSLGDSTSLSPLNNKNLLSFNSSEPLEGAGQSLDYGFAHAPDLNVNGGAPFGKPLFEQGGQTTNLNFAPAGGGEYNLLAMDPGGGFGSTIGPTSGQAVDPQSLPSTQISPQSNSNQLPAQNYGNMQGQGAALDRGVGGQPGADTGVGQSPDGQSLNGQSADGQGADGQTGTQVDAAETTPYTVKEGDNLWDLAGKHMGDSTRWGEIYKLNEAVIGNNPRLIMPGTELQLPGAGAGAEHLAQDYTVKAGDNLWDISKNNLGGGEHWKDLYSHNTDVVGSNPNLIHPGQHLNMNTTGAAHPTLNAHSGHAGNHIASGNNHLSSNHTAGSHSVGNHAVGSHNPHVAHHAHQHAPHDASTTHGAKEIANHSDKAIGSDVSKPAISQADSAVGEKISALKPTANPVELKAVAKSLPGIEIYKDGAPNVTDLGT